MTFQELQFELIKKAGRWNAFDAEKVIEVLKQTQDLWSAFVFGRFEYFQLIPLRDAQHDTNNADTLFILVDKQATKKLIEKLNFMQADEIDICTHERDMLGGGVSEDMELIRVWWD